MTREQLLKLLPLEELKRQLALSEKIPDAADRLSSLRYTIKNYDRLVSTPANLTSLGEKDNIGGKKSHDKPTGSWAQAIKRK